MKNVKISIIVAVYNIEQYVAQCIQSILNQNYANIEILMINDGSKDSSAKIIETFALEDPRIKLINKVNGGLSSARNEGLRNATGDYVIYVDGDDWLNQELCFKLNEFVSKNGDVDIICYSYSLFFNENRQYEKTFEIDERIYSGSTFFQKSMYHVQAWNKAYRKKFLDDVGLFFLQGRLHEDVSYTIPLCMCSKRIAAIPYRGYFYRQNRDGSIMADLKERNIKDFYNAVGFGYFFLKEREILPSVYLKWALQLFTGGGLAYAFPFRIVKKYLVELCVPQIVCEMVDQMGEKQFLKNRLIFFAYFKKRHMWMRLKYLRWKIFNHFKK